MKPGLAFEVAITDGDVAERLEKRPRMRASPWRRSCCARSCKGTDGIVVGACSSEALTMFGCIDP